MDIKKIKIVVIGVLIGSLVLAGLINESDFFVKKRYLSFRNDSYKDVIKTKDDQHPIKSNPIFLSSGRELTIPRKIFDKLNIGDSVIKNKGSDSIIFIADKGYIYLDYNKFRRKKYQETKK